jgi:hypothetical protein
VKRCLFVLALAPCLAQDFSQRGFLETGALLYPETAPGDSGQAVAEALFRYEAFWKPAPAWRVSAGVDARADTHRQVERGFHLSWRDRELRRPAFTARRLSAAYDRGPLSIEVGRQFIRWGKADILNPTDRFAPRDFLNVARTEYLGVTAARLTYGGQSDSLDLVWAPVFSPSRVPLLGQRWAPLPAEVRLVDQGSKFPGGSQFGARWNHIGRGLEYSLSFYEGHNHLPLFDARPLSASAASFQRFYPRLRMYGADAALPLRAVTLKAEAAYFASSTLQADEYVLYVVQLERQAGEWFFVGGYAGQAITRKRSPLDFAPDRGLTRALLGRAGYTIDTNRSLAVETAVRENGDGMWLKFEYSQAFGQHWRATAGFTWIRGRPEDFLGQYRRNSHALLALRYSF